MFEWLLEARVLVILAAVAVFTPFVGTIRRDPPVRIAMDTIGIVAFMAGIFWAGALGTPAMGVVVLVFVGAYLMTTAYERRRTDRKQREEAEGRA